MTGILYLYGILCENLRRLRPHMGQGWFAKNTFETCAEQCAVQGTGSQSQERVWRWEIQLLAIASKRNLKIIFKWVRVGNSQIRKQTTIIIYPVKIIKLTAKINSTWFLLFFRCLIWWKHKNIVIQKHLFVSLEITWKDIVFKIKTKEVTSTYDSKHFCLQGSSVLTQEFIFSVLCDADTTRT